jgi:hypothetical protein
MKREYKKLFDMVNMNYDYVSIQYIPRMDKHYVSLSYGINDRREIFRGNIDDAIALYSGFVDAKKDWMKSEFNRLVNVELDNMRGGSIEDQEDMGRSY